MPRMEPYRIKVVEPIPMLSTAERSAALARAEYNMFNLAAAEVTIDLLSDSGTGAISADQNAAAARGDESYAGSRSWFRFQEVVAELTGFPHILPVHQGRAGERIVFSALLGPGSVSVSNTHFDTTATNVVRSGGETINLPCPEAADLDSPYPWKGDIDLEALERLLSDPGRYTDPQHPEPRADRSVAFVLMTITSNGGGGQPVSMANLRATAQLCRRHGVPFLLDAARFAENAWLVSQRDPEYQGHSPREIARQTFELADGALASLKKDGLSAEGGFIGLRDDGLAATCEDNLIATEGFLTYGGLAGYELERLAQGLREVVEPDYLAARADATAYLARLAGDAGVATVQPTGVHAVYLNAGRLLPHLRPEQFPGHALACQLYLDGGIRSHELGSLSLGTLNAANELVTAAPFELVRLAIPRRVYTQSHLEYVAETLAEIAKNPERVPGYRVVEAPALPRHFRVRLAPAD